MGTVPVTVTCFGSAGSLHSSWGLRPLHLFPEPQLCCPQAARGPSASALKMASSLPPISPPRLQSSCIPMLVMGLPCFWDPVPTLWARPMGPCTCLGAPPDSSGGALPLLICCSKNPTAGTAAFVRDVHHHHPGAS